MGKHSNVGPGFTEAGPLLHDPSVHDPPDGDATNLDPCSGSEEDPHTRSRHGSLEMPIAQPVCPVPRRFAARSPGGLEMPSFQRAPPPGLSSGPLICEVHGFENPARRFRPPPRTFPG